MRRMHLTLIAVITALILLAAGGAYVARAQQALRYVNLNTWPMDDGYRHIIAYPDSDWTHAYLGFVEGARCPPFLARSIDDSQGVWRDPSRDLNSDWTQASRGNRWVACYLGHRGTDIEAPGGAPVYATADGTVSRVEVYEGDEWHVFIDHHRLLDDGLYFEWQARYLHLRPDIPLEVGQQVVEGQVVGYLTDLEDNSHLHFQIMSIRGDLDIFRCAGNCIIDPWGPVWLWVDDDFNARIDLATSVLPNAQPGVDLVGPVSTEHAGQTRWHLPLQVTAGTRLRVQAILTAPTDLTIHPANAPDQAITCTFDAAQGGEIATLLTDLPSAWANPVITISGGVEGQPQAFAVPPDPENPAPLPPRDTACTLKTPAAPSPLHNALTVLGRAARSAHHTP